MYHDFLSIDGHFICSYTLDTVNNAAMNMMGANIFFELMFLFSLDKYPKAELLNQALVIFLVFLKNLHTVFCSGCTHVHSHQQGMKAAFAPSPHLHLWFLVSLIDVVTGVRSSHCGLDVCFPNN